MVQLHHVYVGILAEATFLALGLVYMALLYRRATNVAVPFAVMMLGHAAWSLSLAAVWFAPTAAEQFFFRWLAEVSSLVLAVGFFVVALFVARTRIKFDTRRTMAILLFPAVVIAFMPFNPGRLYRSGYVAERIGGFTLFVPRPGVLYWLIDLGIYGAVIIGLLLVMRVALSSRGVRRKQAIMLLFGWSLPFVSSVAFESGYRPLDGFDPAPIAFLGAGAIWFVALLQGRLLDITPLARDVLVEHMEEGFVVLDANGRIVDSNRTAEQLAGLGRRQMRGESARQILESLGGTAEVNHQDENGASVLVTLGEGDDKRYIDSTIKPLGVGLGDPDAHLVVLHDVTDLKHKQHQLERLNDELHVRLAEINRLKDQLRDQAIRDSLTGLYNRRFLEETLAREKARAERSDLPVAVLMIDIDHFKRVNDIYSHQAGDSVLHTVAQVLSTSARAGDVVCRYGGEEFVVVMPGACDEVAAQRAEDLRKRIERTPVQLDGARYPITVSVGICFLRPDRSPADDIHAADEAMYAAKRAGRNRTVLSEEPALACSVQSET